MGILIVLLLVLALGIKVGSMLMATEILNRLDDAQEAHDRSLHHTVNHPFTKE